MTLTDICSKADKYKGNMEKLKELWDFAKANKSRFAPEEFEFALEHIGGHVLVLKSKLEGQAFEKETSE